LSPSLGKTLVFFLSDELLFEIDVGGLRFLQRNLLRKRENILAKGEDMKKIKALLAILMMNMSISLHADGGPLMAPTPEEQQESMTRVARLRRFIKQNPREIAAAIAAAVAAVGGGVYVAHKKGWIGKKEEPYTPTTRLHPGAEGERIAGERYNPAVVSPAAIVTPEEREAAAARIQRAYRQRLARKELARLKEAAEREEEEKEVSESEEG